MSADWKERIRKSAMSRMHGMDAENDFPFATVTSVRVGSAHGVCRPGQEDRLVQLLRWVAQNINERFEPGAADQPIWVETK